MLGVFRMFTAVFLLLVATLVAAVPFESRQNPEFPSPYVDPFYKPPANIKSLANGHVIRRRTIPSTIQSPDLKEAVQLLYAYTNTSLQRDATVTTLFIPNKPASPPVIAAFNNYEDSTSFDCSPSWALVQGSGSPAAASTNVDQPIFVDYALSQGWYVSFADHEGPKAAFIGGFQEGRAILDGIRASRNDQKLPKSTKVLVHGYSGGGHASVWTVNLQPTYAPDVNIVGAAFGGTPIDPRNILNFLNKGLFAGFAIAGVSGEALAYPELNNFLYPHLTAEGKQKVQQFRAPGFCVGEVATAFPLQDVYSLINLTNPLDYPIPKKVLAEESLLMEVSTKKVAVPKFPRLQYHSLLDEIVPYADELKYVQEQCAQGANIQFQTFPISEHITGQLFGLPGVLLFLTQAAAGTTPKVICGTGLPTFLNVNSPGAAAAVGQNVIKSILALNGKTDPFGQKINLGLL